jgi:GAF domain-containing protein
MNEDELRHSLEELFSEVSPPPVRGAEETRTWRPQLAQEVVGSEEPPSPEGLAPQSEPEPPSAPGVVSGLAEVQACREELIEGLLRALLVVGILALLGGSYFAFRSQDLWVIPVYIGLYALLVLITVWRRLPCTVRIGGLLLLAYAVSMADLFRVGRVGEFRLFLLALPFLATLFLGRRGGAVSLALVVLTMLGFGWAVSTGSIALPLEKQAISPNSLSWLSNAAVLLVLGSLMVVSLDYFVSRLAGALTGNLSLTRDLEEHRDRLQERARALRRQALQLEVSAEVGRAVTSILDIDQLLHQTVELIHDRFGWYFVAVFLLDESGERVDLAAAAGEAGAQMLAKGLQLSVAETSLVGWSAKHRRPRIASNVGEDGLYRPYPLLPRTASEVAFPLIVDDHLLGVLDLESEESGAFDENDVKVLQGLADQVAVAIQNAYRAHEEAALLEATSPFYRASRRLTEALSVNEVLDALIESVAETEADGCVLGLFEPLGGREVEQIAVARTWHRDGPSPIIAGTDAASQAGLTAHARIDVRGDPELGRAYATRWITSDLDDASLHPDEGRPIEGAGSLASRAGFALHAGANFPLAMGDRQIGFFFLYRTASGPFSEASIRLYEMLGDQAAGAMERARLLEEAQRRADRERLISETTARIRESLDVETVLNTAAGEIGRALGLAALDVRLGMELADTEISDLSGGNGDRSLTPAFTSNEEE